MNSNDPSDVRAHIEFLKRKREIVLIELGALEAKLSDLIQHPRPPQLSASNPMIPRSDGNRIRRAIEKKLEARDGLDLRIREWQSQLTLLENRLREIVWDDGSASKQSPVAMDGDFTADENYDSIRFKGKQYGLTPNQSAIIKTLHESHLSGYPVVKLARLQEELRIGRVRDSFRGTNLYGHLILSVARPKGGYRLNLPDPPKKP